jgi:hypothetical protein
MGFILRKKLRISKTKARRVPFGKACTQSRQWIRIAAHGCRRDVHCSCKFEMKLTSRWQKYSARSQWFFIPFWKECGRLWGACELSVERSKVLAALERAGGRCLTKKGYGNLQESELCSTSRKIAGPELPGELLVGSHRFRKILPTGEGFGGTVNLWGEILYGKGEERLGWISL